MSRPLHGSLAALALLLASCRIDIVRVRDGEPLDVDTFESFEVERTTREEALEKLGAPTRVEWKESRDHLWWEYGDAIDAGLRYRIPIAAGYQHTFFRSSENSEALDRIRLVFDEEGVLERKSYQSADAFEEAGSDGKKWLIDLAPRFDYSVYLQGDGGQKDYDRLFEPGYRAGFDLGIQPVPVLTFLLGASYQEYPGDDFLLDGVRWNVDDLRLYQAEAGVRLSFPFEALARIDDFETMKRIFFEEDLEKQRGFSFYVQGTTGASTISNVPVKRDGIRAGTLYDDSLLFSGSIGAGLEYACGWGGFSLGVTYSTTDPFDEGSSELDADADAFSTLLVGGGLSVKF